MKYKVWICVESCDEEYEQYEDVEVPFAKAATLGNQKPWRLLQRFKDMG